jgi:DNA end-binding protein Ku
MQQLHYADEVRSASDIEAPSGEVREPELKLALQIIDQIASDEFDPAAYHDEVQERIEKVIEKKVEGKEVSLAPAAEPKAQIIDLMEALKASVAGKAAGAPKPKAARRAPARTSEEKVSTRKKAARSK